MSVHLTPAQAAKLGLTPPTGKRRTRQTTPSRDCLPVRCVACGDVFTRPCDENRHAAENPTHRRYEAVLA